jgi:hypothetical protein
VVQDFDEGVDTSPVTSTLPALMASSRFSKDPARVDTPIIPNIPAVPRSECAARKISSTRDLGNCAAECCSASFWASPSTLSETSATNSASICSKA